MDVWKFLKSNFFRTNKNWQLIVVEFVSYFVMLFVSVIGIVIPAFMLVIPYVNGAMDWGNFFSTIVSHITYILFVILIFLIFSLVSLVIWAFTSGGIRASLVSNILKNERFELQKFFTNARKYFGRIVGLWTYIGFFYIAIFILLGGIGSGVFLLCIKTYETNPGVAITIGIFLGFIIFLIFAAAGFLLGVYSAIANTYLIVEDASVGDTIRGTYGFIRTYPGHTFLVVILIIGITIGASLAYSIITLPVSMIPYLGAVVSFVLTPISIGINLYITLFSAISYINLYLWKTRGLDYSFQTSIVPENTK
ncbi:MAG: hypothetical protein B5M53_03005 [Candidatus Cloacimonas sp. 4484_209]|nr:MAG: hypothetical protein B5M53_03005 [Candidatus Cloacimonas sp. 4484_209]